MRGHIGAFVGMMCRCCQKTVGPPFGQLLCPDPIALCTCQNTELAPFNAATPLVIPFVHLISVAVQPRLARFSRFNVLAPGSSTGFISSGIPINVKYPLTKS
jgi:hypothetical protein